MVTAKDCIRCGKCTANCEFLKKYNIDIGNTEQLKELAYHCFLCGKCTEVCPKGIDGKSEVLRLRQERIVADNEKSEFEKKYKRAISEKRNYIFRNYKHATSGAVYFPGCNFPSLYPKTSDCISKLLFEKAGIGTIYECCGKPISDIGFIDDEKKIVEGLEKRFTENQITELIVACPNCYDYLKDKLNVKVTSIYSKLLELGIGKKLDGDRTFFLPCPDRAERAWLAEIQKFVNGECKAIEDVQCCGLGGRAMTDEPEIAKSFTEKIKKQVNGKIYAYCASCTGNIKRNGYKEITHILTEILETNEEPCTSTSYVNRVATKYK